MVQCVRISQQVPHPLPGTQFPQEVIKDVLTAALGSRSQCVCMCVPMCVCLCVCMYMCVHVHAYVCAYVCICICVCMCMCLIYLCACGVQNSVADFVKLELQVGARD